MGSAFSEGRGANNHNDIRTSEYAVKSNKELSVPLKMCPIDITDGKAPRNRSSLLALGMMFKILISSE